MRRTVDEIVTSDNAPRLPFVRIRADRFRFVTCSTLDPSRWIRRQRASSAVSRVAGRFDLRTTKSDLYSRWIHRLDRKTVTQAPTRKDSTIDNTYNAAHLLVLEGLEAVRKRPGMYVGSTDTRGLMQCLWEIIDNGVDEALAGAAKRIEVILHADDSAEVHDDGRGIPVDKEPKTGLPGVEVIFTKLHAGGKFGGGSYVATGGLHGVGASVVNALSARLDVDVDRSPAQQGMSFQRGVPGVFADPGPGGRFDAGSGLSRKGKRVAKAKTGTRIRFWPDRQIFTKDAAFVYDELVTRARQTSYIVPGLELVIGDLRGAEQVEEHFSDDGGIAEF